MASSLQAQVDLERLSRECERVVARVAPSVVQIGFFECIAPADVDADSKPGRTAIATLEERFQCSGVVSRKSGEIMTLLRDGIPEPRLGGEISIVVTLHDGRSFPGSFIARDPATGVTLLQVDGAPKLREVAGKPNGVQLGSLVVAVGEKTSGPRGVRFGWVTNLRRPVWTEAFSFPRAIETDIPAEAGTVGGLLANTHGDLVGLLAFAYRPRSDALSGGVSASEELGVNRGGPRPVVMAIPADLLRTICTQLRRNGYVTRGALDADFCFKPDALIQVQAGVRTPIPGAKIVSVRDGGPAANAGLRQGDIVVMVEGRHIRTQEDLIWFAEKVEYGPVGSAMSIKIRRVTDPQTDQYKTVTVNTGERDQRLPSEFHGP